MTLTDQIICIALAALANFATRVTPFLLFRTEAVTPDFVTGLGRFLPAAIMGMLVVYCYATLIGLAARMDCQKSLPAW